MMMKILSHFEWKIGPDKFRMIKYFLLAEVYDLRRKKNPIHLNEIDKSLNGLPKWNSCKIDRSISWLF